ncbi:hypothetical protein AB4P91_08910 [Pseudomonas sp. B21128]|jgi:creatinine amidohydrolase/Fe(II)-dependent formamide hydrolase-like protein|uniref:Uncharacterized protein n=1 Tax=Pseudomonas chlororaphis subsp. aurantiaca TaxID=86192 RepID=A0AAJ0ZQC6_9PSED|nr:hypothetical protein [Pseudomonas chlororaphis]MBU4636283.1 hypothetical protein [Pseudomonas chlororaphis subsp. aurantiaca]
MTMIDMDQLKPASDAAQMAFQEWIEAGKVQARARERGDVVGETRAKATAERNEKLYDQAARSLATQVHAAIGKAEREATQP